MAHQQFLKVSGQSDWVHQSCSLSEAMTRRPSVYQQRRSHFSGQAAWYIKLSSKGRTRRSSVRKQRKSHCSGQVAWYINPLEVRTTNRGGPTSQAKWQMTRRSSARQAEEFPFLRPGGMVHHPTSQAKRQWYINSSLKLHLSGQAKWPQQEKSHHH